MLATTSLEPVYIMQLSYMWILCIMCVCYVSYCGCYVSCVYVMYRVWMLCIILWMLCIVCGCYVSCVYVMYRVWMLCIILWMLCIVCGCYVSYCGCYVSCVDVMYHTVDYVLQEGFEMPKIRVPCHLVLVVDQWNRFQILSVEPSPF